MQQYADIYSLQSHSTCFGRHNTYRTTRTNLSRSGHFGGKSQYQYYDLYRRLRLQFLVLLMMGAVTPETCRVTLQ